MKFLSFLATVALATYTTAQTVIRCGTQDPAEHVKVELNLAAQRQPIAAQPSIRHINTYVHVVTTRAKKGTYTQAEVSAQVWTY